MSLFSFELDPALAADPVFDMHRRGKMAITATVPLAGRDDLSRAYTPGVARVCEAIAADPDLAHDYTWTGNTVAVVTDGSAVLGLGNIGPAAAMPVMEGKAVLFKQFGGVDAVPICLSTQDPEEIIAAVRAMAPSFGGINLEDISAPRCFEIERRLDEALDIPVFHDDQHGTAVVVLAALRNATALLGRRFADLRVVITGAGAAGVAITKMLIAAGLPGASLIVCDSRGILHAERGDLTPAKAELAAATNLSGRAGGVREALIGADVLIGVSGGIIDEEALAGMAPGGIIFALANPTPEVPPQVAARYAAVVATGRSDFPNQINNVLAFPGILRGALDVRATTVTQRMKVAAAEAIAEVVTNELSAEAIVPSALDPRVAPAVAAAVARAAERDGVARRLALGHAESPAPIG
ncbi:NAD(P)-dependent malic enzyme [Mangrovihabitans endophyticus]|uniref:Malate dehydrogenase n=1 Tax=Mangrovihabitans endophyticus TaxID=1751298 RepID=A0A8J3C2P7_9ACTN|nr:NADP-dependent malic enzyme [Mangrovihabitans endophyticus]GGL01466.1 malate dehydrogenase [Mangrovihabitans endophyticus]